MYNFSDSSLSKLKGCDERLYIVAIEAIKESPLDFGISYGNRSIQEQQKLYAQGRTAPGKIVTNCDGVKIKSKHNYEPSKAFDIVVFIDGKANWNIKNYQLVADHILNVAKQKGIQITWGGSWANFPDYPHFQV